MNRVLVTGANGQLGLSIQDIKNDYPELEFIFKDRSELDIANNDQVKDVFGSGNFDYCINCAAYTNVDQAERTPEVAYTINADGVKNLAMACKENNVTLIHISTDYVFDGNKREPYTTEDIPNPINEYGKSKWEGENRIQEILSQYYIIRTSWLYHKIHGHNFYKTILAKAKKGETINVTDEQVGCPTNAANLAQFILGLISQKEPAFGIFHYTDGLTMTWHDFSKKIIIENNLRGVATVVRNNNYRSFARRPKNSVLKIK
ncbi:dTDP-4-dehydrorhamnose reductase [Flavobacteriaceae bacterium KMM 6898]|nr:dTDP-4-dehydrorhamnose reductase [Flavobacteriaceae bacterium KMM 6898]